MGTKKGCIPWNKGIPHSLETRQKISTSNKGKKAWNRGLKGLQSGDRNPFYGRKHTEETKEKMRESAKKKFLRMTDEERKNYGQGWKGKFGSEHIRYKLDRSRLQIENRHNDLAYQCWRRDVYLRDKWKCKISNSDCEGRIEAHHILTWKDFPELRYDTNNGITLCHFHHPRRRKEEKRLVPMFIELMSVSRK
jgi:hypothetical protein